MRPEWDNCSRLSVKRPEEYNALRDPNMRHYFQNRAVQSHLYKTGQIDKSGRVIDFERNKSKLHIIEQEFKAAEKVEFWRKREEEEMRHRVQRKRHEALERCRRQEKLNKIKEDRRVGKELVRAARGIYHNQLGKSHTDSQQLSTKRGKTTPSTTTTTASTRY